MGERIIANVLVCFDESYVTKDDIILQIKEKNIEKYKKLNMKTYPLTKSGKILVEKKPIKEFPTLKASIDLSDFATAHYLMGLNKQEIEVSPTEVNLGRGQTGIVTRAVIPYQPGIHAHLDDDYDKIKRGTVLEFDFSKSKLSKAKDIFYGALLFN